MMADRDTSKNAIAGAAVAASGGFSDWLSNTNGNIAVTAYQAGMTIWVGWDRRRQQVTLLLRQFEKPTGLAIDPTAGGSFECPASIALATQYDIMFFSNAPRLAADYLPDRPCRYDALYLPRATYHTGDIHAHDIALGPMGRSGS